ncbi:glycosyltransferase [Streptosporangium sp. NPDC000396]|uniref:glycosyltransferase n=1 Tax=Streptosporangium sp. NPDC000396 TaxID=3366185 RepID=UPI0036B78D25
MTNTRDRQMNGGRRLAQRGLFTGPSETVSKDLYATVVHGSASRRRTGLSLRPATKVSGDTYFGRFPASYWQRWTDAHEIRVELTVTGAGLLSIVASDTAGPARTVTAHEAETGDTREVTLVAKLDRFVDGGSLWLDLETEADQCLTVENVRWTVDAPGARRQTAVVICTTDRPGECLRNLRALADDRAAMEALSGVYVIDHGTDLVSAQDGFPQVAKSLGDRLRYLTQPNLGGAGGFTRGLYELAGDPATERSSALLMDDDVLLEPDLIVRITAFGDRTACPMIVGGQMLNLFHPHVLLADAQQTDLDGIQPGVPMPHSGQDVDLLGARLQERRLDAGYNGWWACLIPYEVVRDIGYPLPVFFQGDDAEYSYRARAHGFPTITLPGAGLWHADFALKDLDELNRYFLIRNYTIISALHGGFDLPRLVRKLGTELGQHLLAMRYGLADTILRAVDDFLTGPGTLHDGGVTALREVQESRTAYPETVRHPAAAPPGIASHDLAVVNAGPRPCLAVLRRTLDRLLGRHRYALGAVPHDEAHWWHVALFETAVVTDASQQGVRIRRYDLRLMLTLAGRSVKTLLRLRREGAAVRKRYREALPELSSRENWTRLYGLDA